MWNTVVPVRPDMEHMKNERSDATIWTMLWLGNVNFKDNVDVVWSLPIVWNEVDDFRLVKENGWVYRWDWANWVLVNSSWWPIPSMQQIDFISVLIENPQNKNYKFIVNCPYWWEITEITTISSSWTATWTLSINATPITVTPNAISITEDSKVPTALNIFVAGDDLNFNISSNNFAENVSVTIKFIRTLN